MWSLGIHRYMHVPVLDIDMMYPYMEGSQPWKVLHTYMYIPHAAYILLPLSVPSVLEYENVVMCLRKTMYM